MKSTIQTNGGSVAIVATVLVVLAIAGFMFWKGAAAPQEESPATAIIEEDNLSAELDATAKADNSAELSAIDAEFK